MSLRDVEEDVALILEAAGLGSTTSAPPTIYAGPIPAGAPDVCMACLEAPSDAPDNYLSGTGLAYHAPEVTVLVRGPATDSGRAATKARALQGWDALWDLQLPEYVRISPLQGGVSEIGRDDNGCALFSFTVRLEYLLAGTPGLTVPLPSSGPLHVPALEVAGEATVSGLLVVPGLPFASFPAAASKPQGVLFDTTSGLLHVSDGTAWRSLGAPPPALTAAEVTVATAPGLTASTVQEALEQLVGDVEDRATTDELADLSAVVASKADAISLSSHTSATSAHGVAGDVVGTTGAQTLSNKTHSGRLNVTDVSAGSIALAVPQGSWLKLGAAGTNVDVVSSDGTSVFVGSGGSGRLSLATLVVGTDVVLQGGLLRNSNNRTLVYQASVDGSAGAPVGHRFTTAAVVPAATPILEVCQKSGSPVVEVRRWGVDASGKVLMNTGDSSATPGSATLNTPAGKSSIPAGAASIVITNSCCTANSLVRAWVQQATEDATLVRVRATAAAGSLTIYGNAAAAAPVIIGWEVIN